MALDSKTSAASRNLGLNAAFDVLNGGKIRVYDGTKPADADTAITSQTMLVECALNATAFAAAASGVKTANAISGGTVAATGTATWFSLLTSGNVRVLDGTVGTSGCDMTVNSVALSSGAAFSISSLTITQSA